jgi:hypothetical protein
VVAAGASVGAGVVPPPQAVSTRLKTISKAKRLNSVRFIFEQASFIGVKE